MPRWQQSSIKCAPFSDDSLKRMPLLAMTPTGYPWMCAKPHTKVAVKLFEFVKFAAVYDACDYFPDVIRLSNVRRDDTVNLGRIVARLPRLSNTDVRLLYPIQVGDDPPRDTQGMTVVLRIMIGYTGLPAMNIGPAELLWRHDLTDCGFDQRRSSEEYGPLISNDHRFVRHRWDIGSPRRCKTP